MKNQHEQAPTLPNLTASEALSETRKVVHNNGFPDRVRFNWGFHDGSGDAERAAVRDMDTHPDKMYGNGYVRGVLAWKNLGYRPESSDDAWNAFNQVSHQTERKLVEWPSVHSDKAVREGWDIWDSEGSENGRWQVQRIDDPEAFAEAAGFTPPKLASDDDAFRIVANGTQPHHIAARDFLKDHNQKEYNAVMRFADRKLWTLSQLEAKLSQDLAMCQTDFERSMCKAIGGKEIRLEAERISTDRALTSGEIGIASKYGYRAPEERKLPETTKIRLTFDVEYAPNGSSIEQLKENLESVARLAVNEGMLTGGTEAEVEDYKFEAVAHPSETVPKSSLKATQDALSQAMQHAEIYADAVASAVLDACKRQVEKGRSLDGLNLDAIKDRVTRSLYPDNEPDCDSPSPGM